MAPLDLIEPSPYQTSELNPQKVNELVQNLEKNPLTSPIVLRLNGAGKLELVAGRHRLAAYQALGRHEIESVLRELDDDQAERLVFYDNLFAPSLSDYQKYQGFKRRKESRGLTGEQLAEEAGVSSSSVYLLFTFDALPEAAHQALSEHPGAIGATTASLLAPFSADRAELVAQAIRRVAAGEVSQRDAVAWVKSGGVVKATAKSASAERPEPIRVGKRKYAEVVRRGDRLTIAVSAQFASDDELREIEAAVRKVLDERAQALK
jgi:ParB family chromosome partitioning protein